MRSWLTKVAVLGALALAGASCASSESGAAGDRSPDDGAPSDQAADSGSATDDNGSPGEGGAESEIIEGGTAVAAVTHIERLDPHTARSSQTLFALAQVYDTLVRSTEDGQIEPALAESWEQSNDGLTWTFRLRDVRFHSGDPVTADAVIANFERIMDPETGSDFADNLASIEEMEAPDDRTVVLRLAVPRGDLLLGLSAYTVIANPVHFADGGLDENGDGTGPFTVEDFTADGVLTLAANDDFWAEGPYLDELVFRPIPDATARLAGMQTGEVHWAWDVGMENVEQVRSSDELVLEEGVTPDTWFLALQSGAPPFDDPRVRQAVAMAVDRDAVADAATLGTGAGSALVFPEGHSWHNDYVPYERDPEGARQLLTEAGQEGLSFSIKTPSTGPGTVRAAEALQQQLAEAGITVTIESQEFGEIVPALGRGEFEGLIMAIIGARNPHEAYHKWHASDGSFNTHGHADPTIDELLRDARAETDEGARADMYTEAERLIADAAPIIYLYNLPMSEAIHPSLQGFTARADRQGRFDTAWLADQ